MRTAHPLALLGHAAAVTNKRELTASKRRASDEDTNGARATSKRQGNHERATSERRTSDGLKDRRVGDEQATSNGPCLDTKNRIRLSGKLRSLLCPDA